MGCYCIYKNISSQPIKKNDVVINDINDKKEIKNPNILKHESNQNLKNEFQFYSSKILPFPKKKFKFNNINTEEKSEDKSSIKQSSKGETFYSKIKTKSKPHSEKKVTKNKHKHSKSCFSQNNARPYKPILSFLEQRAKEKEKRKSEKKFNK